METLVLVHRSGDQLGKFRGIQVKGQLIAGLHPLGSLEVLELGLLSVHILQNQTVGFWSPTCTLLSKRGYVLIFSIISYSSDMAAEANERQPIRDTVARITLEGAKSFLETEDSIASEREIVLFSNCAKFGFGRKMGQRSAERSK